MYAPRLLVCRRLQEATWDVPHLFAWHKVYVDDKGSVVAPPPEEEAEDFEGEGALD